MIIKAFVDREYNEAWAPARLLRETTRQVQAEGSLICACPDGTIHGFKQFKFLQWQ
jgi:hypothetical protein